MLSLQRPQTAQNCHAHTYKNILLFLDFCISLVIFYRYAEKSFTTPISTQTNRKNLSAYT